MARKVREEELRILHANLKAFCPSLLCEVLVALLLSAAGDLMVDESGQSVQFIGFISKETSERV